MEHYSHWVPVKVKLKAKILELIACQCSQHYKTPDTCRMNFRHQFQTILASNGLCRILKVTYKWATLKVFMVIVRSFFFRSPRFYLILDIHFQKIGKILTGIWDLEFCCFFLLRWLTNPIKTRLLHLTGILNSSNEEFNIELPIINSILSQSSSKKFIFSGNAWLRYFSIICMHKSLFLNTLDNWYNLYAQAC